WRRSNPAAAGGPTFSWIAFAPRFVRSKRRPVGAQDLLGDRAKGERGQVLQRRDDRDDAEQKDHERRVIRWNGSRRRLGLFLRRERSGDRQNRYGVSKSSEKHREAGRDVVPRRVGVEPGERRTIVRYARRIGVDNLSQSVRSGGAEAVERRLEERGDAREAEQQQRRHHQRENGEL